MKTRSFAALSLGFAFVGLSLSSFSLSGCGGTTPVVQDPTTASAAHVFATKHEAITYQAGEATLDGYLAYPEGAEGKRPGVVLFPDWMGLGPNPKKRADQLAALGYVVLAADLYGKGVRPADAGEAAKLATKYKEDRATLRARGRAGMDALVASGKVDPTKVAAIGYCFGGTAALELARSGAPLSGVVSFHGGLATPHADDAKNIKAKVLALHGADDPFVKAEEVTAFQDEMRKGKVDWSFVSYGGAVHSFTIEDAGNDNSKGAAYNANADHRSWDAMRTFFRDLWGN